MSLPPGFHTLWPTPMGVHRYADAQALNPSLVRIFGALRATQAASRGEPGGAFFASDDDLLQRVQLPEWQALVRFVVQGLSDTVAQADRGAWPAALPGAGLPHVDLDPVPGQLLLFPSWLAHQALPYDGEQDRVIVSFNASVHSAQGTDRLHGYRAA